MAELISISGPKKTDAEMAAAIRAEISPVLQQICDIMNAADKHDLTLGFNISRDSSGRHRVLDLKVTKVL